MMARLPAATENIRLAPVRVLRGFFSGIGQLLLAADRMRETDTGGKHARTPAPSRASRRAKKQAEPPRFRSLDLTGNVRMLSGQDIAEPAQLPITGYDELSAASLRARLRNLDAGQLQQLLDYERSNQSRADVMAMFERRIARLNDEAG
jgi:hypothetical protein